MSASGVRLGGGPPQGGLTLLHDAEELLLSEGPVIPIYHYTTTELVKPYGIDPLANVLIGDGEAIRISTGAMVPDGADAVLQQELIEDHDAKMRSTMAHQ